VQTTYTVIGTDLFGCASTATVNFLVDPCVGVTERNMIENMCSIFPNPGSEQLNVVMSKAGADMKISLYNSTGQLVISSPLAEGLNRLQVTDLANGVYHILVTDSGAPVRTGKWIKQ
jgi:hypothetical protein